MRLKYRNLILCVFGLDRPCFSPNASLYFPGAEFPFTRLYEPKNRSRHMAPEGQTAIVLELPCFREDAVWNMSAEALRRSVMGKRCQRVKPIAEGEVVCFATYKLPFAYPVLKVGLAEHVERLVTYFQTFENLHLTGRSSLFRYVHLHDLFKAGRELVARSSASWGLTPATGILRTDPFSTLYYGTITRNHDPRLASFRRGENGI